MDSPEYNSVLKNMSKIVDKLEATDSTSRLATKFQEKKWAGITANPTAKELVNIILNRITLAVADFNTFIEMLGGIVGLDQIVTLLEDTRKENSTHE